MMPHDCDLPAEVAIAEIQSYVRETAKDSSLREEKNFDSRIEVMDFIGFQLTNRMEELLQKTAYQDKLILLTSRAGKLKSELEEINDRLFQKLQAEIRTGKYTGKEFKDLINEYVDFNLADNQQQEEPGYDNLDIFINGLFPFHSVPEQTRDLEPEMVYIGIINLTTIPDFIMIGKIVKHDQILEIACL